LKPVEKLPLLLMPPLGAIAIFVISGRSGAAAYDLVSGARDWVLICVSVYTVALVVAWFLRHSWPAAMGRMLLCGLFAYVGISRIVDIVGRHWSNVWQIFGAAGSLPTDEVAALRWALAAWTVCLGMMVTAIATGFEGEGES